VLTIGGIYGTVVNVPKGAEEITLRIDESNNTRIRIQRSAVARILTESDSGTKDTKESEA
jgi:preprotein translocase subunit YajC